MTVAADLWKCHDRYETKGQLRGDVLGATPGGGSDKVEIEERKEEDDEEGDEEETEKRH